MRKVYTLSVVIVAALMLASCSARFDSLVAEGKYEDAENLLKRMPSGAEQDKCADMLIQELISFCLIIHRT